MECYKLLYKSFRDERPYDRYLQKQWEKQIEEKKQLMFGRVMKFLSSRYPKQLLQKLDKDIDPFQLSLDKFKDLMIAKYPQYPEDIVAESTEYVFTKKYQQSIIIKQSPLIIENGREKINNGRKLMKEQFTYNFLKMPKNQEISFIPQSSTDRNKGSNSIDMREGNNTSRIIKTDRSKSQSKIMEAALINQRFNNLIQLQLKQQKKRFQNIETILDDGPQDIINRKNTIQSNNLINDKSFPTFKEGDIIHQDDGFDTSRTQLQQLQQLLSISARNNDASESNRSKNSKYQLRIKPQVMQNLYTVKGNIKMNIVKKAVSQIKNQID